MLQCNQWNHGLILQNKPWATVSSYNINRESVSSYNTNQESASSCTTNHESVSSYSTNQGSQYQSTVQTVSYSLILQYEPWGVWRDPHHLPSTWRTADIQCGQCHSWATGRNRCQLYSQSHPARQTQYQARELQNNLTPTWQSQPCIQTRLEEIHNSPGAWAANEVHVAEPHPFPKVQWSFQVNRLDPEEIKDAYLLCQPAAHRDHLKKKCGLFLQVPSHGDTIMLWIWKNTNAGPALPVRHFANGEH